jgi:hypothetical protein
MVINSDNTYIALVISDSLGITIDIKSLNHGTNYLGPLNLVALTSININSPSSIKPGLAFSKTSPDILAYSDDNAIIYTIRSITSPIVSSISPSRPYGMNYLSFTTDNSQLLAMGNYFSQGYYLFDYIPGSDPTDSDLLV